MDDSNKEENNTNNINSENIDNQIKKKGQILI